jgi:hypothetical protein
MKASELVFQLRALIAKHGDPRIVMQADFLSDADPPELMVEVPEHCEWQAEGGFEPPMIVIH